MKDFAAETGAQPPPDSSGAPPAEAPKASPAPSSAPAAAPAGSATPAPAASAPDVAAPREAVTRDPGDPSASDGPEGGDRPPRGGAGSTSANRNRRRRGTRGGASGSGSGPNTRSASTPAAEADDRQPDELPDRPIEGRPSREAAAAALVPRKPQIGDTLPSTPADRAGTEGGNARTGQPDGTPAKRRRRRGGRGRSGSGGGTSESTGSSGSGGNGRGNGSGGGRSPKGGGRPPAGVRSGVAQPVTAVMGGSPVELDDDALEARRGRERNGRPVGRYLMAVHVRPEATQIAVLEGRALLEHYVSRPTDDVSQIHGNIYLGRVQNVLPGMEAAFVDIGTPKNAVLYRGDVHYDPDDVDDRSQPKIEQMLKAKQVILCQVTKNPIGFKGARLTQEVSLPGRFVVLVPNSKTYGISKRLSDEERKRLRNILDKVKPAHHGVIVRTAAENVTSEEIERDVTRLIRQWEQIEALAKKASSPALLYREPDVAVRVIREEFNKDYRKVVIDDQEIFEEVRDYVASISPALADRVEFYDPATEQLPLLERHHIHEQLHKALDRKVWLPSGGSLIIEHTEALTVIDVNTGKNVGTSSLEETVYRNNLEAAEEIARQLRLRDVGGIIVIDFIDMEIRANRDDVIKVFRSALARDKTRTQVFDISELGLVEMTRKRIGEGLLESFTSQCAVCEGRGVIFDKGLL
jgi:ribonuclease E